MLPTPFAERGGSRREGRAEGGGTMKGVEKGQQASATPEGGSRGIARHGRSSAGREEGAPVLARRQCRPAIESIHRSRECRPRCRRSGEGPPRSSQQWRAGKHRMKGEGLGRKRQEASERRGRPPERRRDGTRRQASSEPLCQRSRASTLLQAPRLTPRCVGCGAAVSPAGLRIRGLVPYPDHAVSCVDVQPGTRGLGG